MEKQVELLKKMIEHQKNPQVMKERERVRKYGRELNKRLKEEK